MRRHEPGSFRHGLRFVRGTVRSERMPASMAISRISPLESRLSNPTPHHIQNTQPMPAQITIGFVSPRASLRSGNRALPRHARLPCLPGEPSPLCDVDSCKSISSGDDFPQTRIAKEHQGATTHHHHRKSARKRPANRQSRIGVRSISSLQTERTPNDFRLGECLEIGLEEIDRSASYSNRFCVSVFSALAFLKFTFGE